MNPKDKDKVIGPGKPNEVSKKPVGVWNQQTGQGSPKKSNRAVDARKEAQRDIGAHE